MHWALVGPGGHCEGVLTVDGGDGTPPVVHPGLTAEAVSQAQSVVLRSQGHHAIRRPEGWTLLPEAYGQAIDRSRGIRADHAVRIGRRRLAALQGHDLPLAGVSLAHEGDPRLAPPPPARWSAPEAWAETVLRIRPGLTVRHMTEAEVNLLAFRMRSSGAYEPWTLEECWTQAHSWLTDPGVWALTLEWEGEPLQFEMIHFDAGRSTARGGFVTRLSRERPSWFWRECSRPVFEKLMALGYTKFTGHVRPDRKDWADSLTETYGAENLGLINGFWTLRYDLATMIDRATGWRTSETAGYDWKTSSGNLTVWESPGRMGEVIQAASRIETAWAGRPRGTYAARMVKERLALDAGTLLLGYVGMAVRTVWVMRWKAPGVVNWAVATPWDQSPENGRLYRLAVDWCLAAGFRTAWALFPGAHWEHPFMATQRLRMGWQETTRLTTETGTWVEATADLALLRGRSIEAWEGTA